MPAFIPHWRTAVTATVRTRRLRSFLDRLRSQNHLTRDTNKPSITFDALAGFTWPDDPTFEAVGKAIASARGLEITVMPIPDQLRHREISGLTTVTGSTAYVFYDTDLSPLNREQTILHEFAHILHEDVKANADCTHLRSMFDDPVEKRAEATGMRLLGELRQRTMSPDAGQASELLEFFSGTDKSNGLR